MAEMTPEERRAAEEYVSAIQALTDELRKHVSIHTRMRSAQEGYINALTAEDDNIAVASQAVIASRQAQINFNNSLSSLNVVMEQSKSEILKSILAMRVSSVQYSLALDTAAAELAEASTARTTASENLEIATLSVPALTSQIADLTPRVQEKEAEVTAAKGQVSVTTQSIEAKKQYLQDNPGKPGNDIIETEIAQLGIALAHNRAVLEAAETEYNGLNSQLQSAKAHLNDANTAIPVLTKEVVKAAEAEKIKEAALKNLQIEALAAKFNNASDLMSKVATALNDLIVSIRKTQVEFGVSVGQAASTKITNIIESVKSRVTSIVGLGRAPGVSQAEIQAAQTGFQGEFGGVVTSESAKRIAVEAKQLGITSTQLADARRVFMTQTMNDVSGAKERQSSFIEEFRKKGLTSKDAMAAISGYSELLARNGTRFAESFARAAADAKKIGVDLSKISQVGDNIIGDFEGFLEKTAELGGMGFNFDVNRISQAAESGDTGALFEELRSQLAATGKDITKLRRSEQLAITSTFGLTMADIQRLGGPKGKEGSGEELTGVEGTNSFLSKLVNFAEGVVPALIGIAGILSGVHSGLLMVIARNTAINAGVKGTGTVELMKAVAPKTTTIIGRGYDAVKGGIAGAARGAVGAARGVGGFLSGIGSALSSASIMVPLLLIAASVATIVLLIKAYQAYKASKAAEQEQKGNEARSVISNQKLYDKMGVSGYEEARAKNAKIIEERKLGVPGTTIAAMPSAIPPTTATAITPATVLPPTSPTIQPEVLGPAAVSVPVEKETKPSVAPVSVDMTKLETKLDQVIKAIGSMEIRMDGSKVGKVIVTADQRAASTGVFRTQRLG